MKILPVFLLAALVAACDITDPHSTNRAMLDSIKFTQAETGTDEVLVITAYAQEELVSHDSAPVVVTTSSGDSATSYLRPFTEVDNPLHGRWDVYREVSDNELLARLTQLANLGARAYIGFREAEDPRGVTYEERTPVSDETLDDMQRWLSELGVTITMPPRYTPNVSVQLSLNPSLLAIIRAHENVNYVEPIAPICHVSEECRPIPNVYSVIYNAASAAPDGQDAIRANSGDTVTLTYEQPDGSVLTSVTTIRE